MSLFHKPVDFTKPKVEKTNLDMSWTEIILYTVFILSVIFFALLGVMKGETSGNRLQMTQAEVSKVMSNLERRSAADCVLTRTDYGFVCKEMASGKIYKVKVR